MASPESVDRSDDSSELASWLERLRQNTLAMALPALGVLGAVILGSIEQIQPSVQSMVTAAMLFLLAGLVWCLRRWRYLAAASVLVLGCMALDLYIVVWSGLDLAIVLLAIPVGLATLTISRVGGVLAAALCTAGMLLTPPTLLNLDPSLKTITMLMLWSTVGMIWLTLTPLLTAVKWAWTSCEHSRTLLEGAQETQVRLHETLEDLADANVQLVRLNRQAQALRQVAEDERHAKEQFVANVSHEMRTPLNMIVGFCEMITRAPESYGNDVPPTLLADLEVVLRNSQHLSSLIEDVLDLSQLEAGQMALTKERVTLPELVQAVTIAVRPLFESKGLYLETEIESGLPLIFCDRTRIREVLLNLLSNAGRFTQEGGVRLKAWQEGRNVTVSVQDTGPGIAEKDQTRLFRPFQQADNSIRRRYGGTGLGLSISKSFVELHGGRMWLESTVGAGTTFFFTLPIDPPVPLEDSPTRWITPGWEFLQRTHPTRVPPPTVRPRLVVVEEGNALHRLLGRYLTDTEIVPLSHLEAACAELSRVPSQALVVNASHLDEALQRLDKARDLPCDIPVIICAIPGIEQAISGLGVADYLVKPISQQALLEALDRLQREVKTVLVVDDEPDALRLFRRILVAADRGYHIVRAASGQQALDVLRQEPVDVVLLDLVMPEMDGFQLLALKDQDESLREIPVILISARDPMGQPIVSNVLAVTRKQGLSTRELIASIQAFGTILSPVAFYEAESRQRLLSPVVAPPPTSNKAASQAVAWVGPTPPPIEA